MRQRNLLLKLLRLLQKLLLMNLVLGILLTLLSLRLLLNLYLRETTCRRFQHFLDFGGRSGEILGGERAGL